MKSSTGVVLRGRKMLVQLKMPKLISTRVNYIGKMPKSITKKGFREGNDEEFSE